jgi:hypothetical protein
VDATDYWQLFMETGAPEIYLIYQMTKRTEEPNVPDNRGPGAAGHGLQ